MLGDTKQSYGDQCLSCHQVHQACFTYLTWAELCERHAAHGDLQKKVATAKSNLEKKTVVSDANGEFQQGVVQIGVEIEKGFEALSEREMRAAAKLGRVPKMKLK
eukprot:2098207-Amphidinium_carterae.2